MSPPETQPKRHYKTNAKQNYITILHLLKNKTFPTLKPLHEQNNTIATTCTHTDTPNIFINETQSKLTLIITSHHRWRKLKNYPPLLRKSPYYQITTYTYRKGTRHSHPYTNTQALSHHHSSSKKKRTTKHPIYQIN